MIAGLTSEGVDALRVGVLPTPAVAYLTNAYDADFGVMISASHNPMPDNGIKIFGRRRAQARRRHRGPRSRNSSPPGPASGRSARASAGSSTPRTRWTATCATSARPLTTRLDGLTVVVDCAHGAASAAAPRAYRAAGANVDRDQRRAQRPEHQRRLRIHAHGGAAAGGGVPRRRPGPGPRRRRRPLPGRRRRRRSVVDGDAIMVILALAMREAGELASNTLVATVMSNLGLHLAMRCGGHRGPHHRRRRPLRARGTARRRVLASAASSPATS